MEKEAVGKRSIPKDGMARSPPLSEPRFMSRLRNYSVGKRNAIQVAPRFAERHEKRALCGTLNAISNLPLRRKKNPFSQSYPLSEEVIINC